MKFVTISVICFIQILNLQLCSSEIDSGDISYWVRQNRKLLQTKISQIQQIFKQPLPTQRKAKNVIFFLGDGMGLSTVTAARIYKGMLDGMQLPEEGLLEFEKFPFASLAKVNSFDTTVADSASTATSYLCGVKCNKGTIGVTGKVKKDDCHNTNNRRYQPISILKWAQWQRKSTGIVTTTRVTHASPAGSYAHIPNRHYEWEAPEECEDIGKQLIRGDTGKHFKVILGGGRKVFLPKKGDDNFDKGSRDDGLNLIQEWLNEKQRLGKKAKYVTSKSSLSSVNENDVDYLLGLFNEDHLLFNLQKTNETDEPSLVEMTEKAIKVLSKNKQGFALFVEGGRIDHAHHGNMAKAALDETYQFNEAIKKALSMVDLEETLVIVTADHSHTLTINGYQPKGQNILGVAEGKGNNTYTTLMYGNGPGFKRNNVSDTTDSYYKQLSAAYNPSAAHGGEDVPVYATGPGSYLFTGVFDQTYIPHAISYATCMGYQSSLCWLPHSKCDSCKE